MRRILSWAAGAVLYIGFFIVCRQFTYSIYFAQSPYVRSDWFPFITGATLLLLIHALLTAVLTAKMTRKHFLLKQIALLAVVVFMRLLAILYSFDAGYPFWNQFVLQCLRHLPGTLCFHMTIQVITLAAMGKVTIADKGNGRCPVHTS